LITSAVAAGAAGAAGAPPGAAWHAVIKTAASVTSESNPVLFEDILHPPGTRTSNPNNTSWLFVVLEKPDAITSLQISSGYQSLCRLLSQQFLAFQRLMSNSLFINRVDI
jgi:hypothetical protein